jgi:hypothetical protein
MIPKKIFFYWGNETMSWMRYMTLYSFRLMNPDWKIIVYHSKCGLDKKTWGSKEQQDFHNFASENYIDRLTQLHIEFKHWDLADNKIIKTNNITTMGASHKSDFFKWCILHDEGGIYSDFDIIYFRSLDKYYELLNRHNYDVAICQTNYLSVGFLAATQYNEFYKDIFKNALNRYTPKQYQSAGVQAVYDLYNTSGPKGVLNTAIRKYPNLKFYNNPFALVYPYDSENVAYAFNTDIKIASLSQVVIGYHWYAGHPVSQKYNNLLNENNYVLYNNLFCNIAKEILSKGGGVNV